MMAFNVTLLNQPIQNILAFYILMDLILLLLIYLRIYSSMSDRLSFYFMQHKHLSKPSIDCFLTCSIILVTCNINYKKFWSSFKKIFAIDRLYTFLSHK